MDYVTLSIQRERPSFRPLIWVFGAWRRNFRKKLYSSEDLSGYAYPIARLTWDFLPDSPPGVSGGLFI
jgi:hypothetical protein